MYDKPLEKKISFVLNLFLFDEYNIHKCRWAKNTHRFVHFEFELCQYFKAFEDARNAKVKKTAFL